MTTFSDSLRSNFLRYQIKKEVLRREWNIIIFDVCTVRERGIEKALSMAKFNSKSFRAVNQNEEKMGWKKPINFFNLNGKCWLFSGNHKKNFVIDTKIGETAIDNHNHTFTFLMYVLCFCLLDDAVLMWRGCNWFDNRYMYEKQVEKTQHAFWMFSTN